MVLLCQTPNATWKVPCHSDRPHPASSHREPAKWCHHPVIEWWVTLKLWNKKDIYTIWACLASSGEGFKQIPTNILSFPEKKQVASLVSSLYSLFFRCGEASGFINWKSGLGRLVNQDVAINHPPIIRVWVKIGCHQISMVNILVNKLTHVNTKHPPKSVSDSVAHRCHCHLLGKRNGLYPSFGAALCIDYQFMDDENPQSVEGY